jgi:mono/diheme cytochrome c family protein
MRCGTLRRTSVAAAVALAATAGGCSDGGGPALSPAAERGKAIYMGVCSACHNPNPALDGSIGPALAGSSRALVEARVVHATYPPGYHPKRSSHVMPAFPKLAGEVDNLTAWLRECCPAR